MSARVPCVERAGRAVLAFTASDTAVLRPEKLNSSPARSSMGRGKSKRPALPSSGQLRQLGPAGVRQA